MEKIEYIIGILDSSKNPIALECLSKIKTEEIHFQPGFIKEKKEMESLYELRLRMAEDLNKGKFQWDELKNWNEAIKELRVMSFNQILLSSITTRDKLYMIFVNVDNKILGAIFYLYQKQSLKDLEKHREETIERGHSSSTLRYIKGKLIEWDSNVG